MRLIFTYTALAVSITSFFDPAAAAAAANPSQDSAQCCASLEKILAKKTYSKSNQQDLYKQSVSAYFNVPDRLNPTCVVAPTSTQDVSQIVALLSKNSCKFAIKAGGHIIPPKAANIQDGVTIDLSSMKTVTLSPDKKFASVQPGAKWIEVYTYLDALGYAIPGGRAGDVGVGGLTTGGGNSFFAARYGFVCDNVQNFEVVLGSGRIVNANVKTNPDLFQALKGGSNNIGLVTRFDIVAFPQGPLWGGTALYNITKREQLQPHLKALNTFTNSIAQDPYGSLILVWSYLPQMKQYSFQNLYEYTRPVTDPKIFPPPFKDFAPTSPVGPPATNTLRIAGLANLTGELDAPPNLRNIYATITFTNDLKVLSKVTDLVQGIFTKTLRNPFYMYYSIQYQPLPTVFASHSIERGGNVLGLERYKDNNIIFLLNVAWLDAKNDPDARRLADETINTLTAYTRSVGALKDFVYLNYADINQDPIGGYGSANVAKLKAASKKYDPGQVFQKLVPGGFKLR